MLLGSRYELAEEIGRGGEARVGRAHDRQTGSAVAVRLPLTPGLPLPSAAVPPSHPGWVRLLDRGHDPVHGAYQILELLPGPTLAAAVAPGPLTAEAWVNFVRQALDAVAALHDAGWTHGDLNAGNFLTAPDGSWRLLDLPFLRFTPPEKRSAQFGDIHTLAPEQIDGHPPDARSDLYALGCLFYFAATGAYPHAGPTPAALAVERLRFPAAPLAEKSSHLAPHRAVWVMQLLERRPPDRPADAAVARRLLTG